MKVKIENQEVEAKERKFKTGNHGFGCYGRMKFNEKEYMVILNIVEMKK